MRLTPNCAKLVEAILFLIEEGTRLNKTVTQYDIVKSLWDADVAHLNTYGRPVTFDNYYALEHGPVPTTGYNMLMQDFRWSDMGLERAPWRATEGDGASFNYWISDRSANLRLLSKSDQSALSAAIERVLMDGFWKTRQRTHEHPAWKNAWAERGESGRAPINYADLFETPDNDAVEDLAYASAHA